MSIQPFDFPINDDQFMLAGTGIKFQLPPPPQEIEDPTFDFNEEIRFPMTTEQKWNVEFQGQLLPRTGEYIIFKNGKYLHLYKGQLAVLGKIELPDQVFCSAEISPDEQLLVVTFRQGNICVYDMGNFQLIHQSKFEINFSFVYINFINYVSLDFYEVVMSDEEGSSCKIYFNMFKIFTKKTIQISYQQLLDKGEIHDPLTTKKQWWLERTQEMRVNYQTQKILYDVTLLPGSDPINKFVFMGFLFAGSLDIYKVYFGKKTPDRGYVFISIISRYIRPNIDSIVERYNHLSPDRISI